MIGDHEIEDPEHGDPEWVAAGWAWAAVFGLDVDVVQLAAAAAERTKASGIAKFGQQPAAVSPLPAAVSPLPAAPQRLRPRVAPAVGRDETAARLERRQALRRIVAAGPAGVPVVAGDASTVGPLVAAGLVSISAGVARATPLGLQATAAA